MISPFQFPVLIIGQVKGDLPKVTVHLHLEDVSVFKGAKATGAAGELFHGLARVEEGGPGKFGALTVGVEKGDSPSVFVDEGHEHAVHDSSLAEAARLAGAAMTLSIQPNNHLREVVHG